MEAFIAVMLLVLLIVFVVWVISVNSKDKGKYKDRYVSPPATDKPDRGPLWNPGFRGELGSPGTSPKIVGPHSVNCECAICLYGHDPDKKPHCNCRLCESYRRGKPLHYR